jgi:hypothetical protein
MMNDVLKSIEKIVLKPDQEATVGVSWRIALDLIAIT